MLRQKVITYLRSEQNSIAGKMVGDWGPRKKQKNLLTNGPGHELVTSSVGTSLITPKEVRTLKTILWERKQSNVRQRKISLYLYILSGIAAITIPPKRIHPAAILWSSRRNTQKPKIWTSNSYLCMLRCCPSLFLRFTFWRKEKEFGVPAYQDFFLFFLCFFSFFLSLTQLEARLS